MVTKFLLFRSGVFVSFAQSLDFGFLICSGHGSFSNDHKLNSVVGHLLHSSILVPYHGWRISHRTHHQNHGHVENDESWHPLSEKIYRTLDSATRFLRFKIPFPLLAYPFYLVSKCCILFDLLMAE